MRRIVLFACLGILQACAVVSQMPVRTQYPLTAFSGTYTFQMAGLKDYSVMNNMNGQEVGFCEYAGPVVGYGCWDTYTFDVLTGTLTADGEGHITSGNYTMTSDPNSYECNPKNNPTDPCPVIVPSGNVYSVSTSYAVGTTVDFTVGSTTLTFQAVRPSSGKPPDWSSGATSSNICNNNGNLGTCYWTQIPKSLTGKNGNATGNLAGTYTINQNGLGVMAMTPSNCGDCGSVEFTFVVSPVSGVGQSISFIGVNTLGSSNNMMGSGVRVR